MISRRHRHRERIGAIVLVLMFTLVGVRPAGGFAQVPPSDAPDDCVDSDEPNDEPSDAQALPEITACVTAEHDEAGQDLFTWSVSAADAAQRWTITTTGIPGQAISLQVYDGELDPDGIVVNQLPLAKSDGGAGIGASLGNLLWPAGDYLIGVATSGAGAYRIDIVPGDPVQATDEFEPNDAADTAESVTGAFAVAGDRTDTEDWYAWEIPNASETQLWRLAIQYPVGIVENLTLYREDLTTIFDRTAGLDGRLVLDDIGLPAGRYYIAVPAAVEVSGA